MRMKKLNLVLMAIAMFILTSGISAQKSAKTDDPVEKALCCKGKSYYNIPDLTDEQKKKIEELEIAHLKEVNLIKAQLKEKHAHLNTLQLAEKPNNSEINKTIDEITSLKNEMMKKHETNRQNIRALLTDKQKVIFDTKGRCSHSKTCGNDCKSKGCSGKCKANASSCSHDKSEHIPVKGKGCCHR
jgi:Spy/CpxP family protein refolding chaperone